MFTVVTTEASFGSSHSLQMNIVNMPECSDSLLLYTTCTTLFNKTSCTNYCFQHNKHSLCNQAIVYFETAFKISNNFQNREAIDSCTHINYTSR